MVKNLIFDFGKVLVDYDYMSVINDFFTNEDRKNAFCKKILTLEWTNFLDREDKPFMENIKYMQSVYPEYKEELQQFGERYIDFVTCEIPGMRDLLINFKSKGYKLYGLSNWCSVVHDVMNQYSEIFSLLDGSVLSSEEHLIKPDIKIYQRLCEKFSLNPEECVFTDDKEINIVGAKNAGMNAIKFSNTDQYKQELSKFLNYEKF